LKYGEGSTSSPVSAHQKIEISPEAGLFMNKYDESDGSMLEVGSNVSLSLTACISAHSVIKGIRTDYHMH